MPQGRIRIFLLGLAMGCVLGLSGAEARADGVSIEAEDLVSSARASAGAVHRQDMRGFGAGWSGNAQLFWGAPPPVDQPIRNWPHLDLSFPVGPDGRYEVVLHHTAAPDFATFRVFLDGQPVADIDGYAPGVSARARSLGERSLTPGRHALVITVFGKAAGSTGYAVGLDRIELLATSSQAAGNEGAVPAMAPVQRRQPAERQRAQQAEQQRQQAEQQRRQQAEQQRRQQAEQQRRQQAEQQRQQAEQQRRQQAEQQRQQADRQRRQQAELDRRQAEVQRRQQAEERRRQLAEQQRHQSSSGRPGRPNQGGGGQPQIPIPQLSFAQVSGITQKWTEKGGTERTFDHLDLHQHLVLDAPYAKQLDWRWQVSLQPFPDVAGGQPPNLVGQDDASSPAFVIDFGKFSALKSGKSRTPSIDFHIRVLPMRNGKPAGPPSNTVVAHYVAGSNMSSEVTQDAFEKEAQKKREKALLDALKTLSSGYAVEIVSFTPAVFDDPNQWGCVVILENPYADSNPLGMGVHELAKYKPGKWCPPPWKGMGNTPGFWDYVGGWAKAYDIARSLYDDAKSWVATQFAKSLPCPMLGKEAGAECEKYAAQLAGAAMNVGLTAAGVPPSLPSLTELAKGQAVDAGVDFSCTAIEAGGGKCTPQLRTILKKAYGKGLDQLEGKMAKVTKEPGCESGALAGDHPGPKLPCFSDYPEVKFKPAPGAVYEPPMVTIRLSRKGTGGALDKQTLAGKVTADLRLDNTVPEGTQIEKEYQPLAKDVELRGNPFAPGEQDLPPLGPGQSMTMTLSLGGIRPDAAMFSTTEGGYAMHNGWCSLYRGGRGPLTVQARCTAANGAGYACSPAAERTVQIPNDGLCAQ
jgi:hypothetical protein